MKYYELIRELKNKYGPVQQDYFDKNDFLIKQKIYKDDPASGKYRPLKKILKGRGKEGLYCHHIDESKAILLSGPEEFVFIGQWEFQKKDRLVWCDLYEHALLHFLIFSEHPDQKNEYLGQMVGVGGFKNFIIPQAISYFAGFKPKNWEIAVYEKTINREKDFIRLIRQSNITKGFSYGVMCVYYPEWKPKIKSWWKKHFNESYIEVENTI